MTGQDCDALRADLVGGIAVGRDAIGTSDDCLYTAFAHDLCCHRIADQGALNITLHQLPTGESGSLQKGPRFVDPHVGLLAASGELKDHRQRGPFASCS